MATKYGTLSVETQENPEVTLVNLSGEFRGREAYEGMRGSFRALLDGKVAAKLVVNMAGVTKIDSGAMGTMAEASVSAGRQGGDIVLAEVPEKIRLMLEITNLVTLFEIYPDTDSAVASFQKN